MNTDSTVEKLLEISQNMCSTISVLRKKIDNIEQKLSTLKRESVDRDCEGNEMLTIEQIILLNKEVEEKLNTDSKIDIDTKIDTDSEEYKKLLKYNNLDSLTDDNDKKFALQYFTKYYQIYSQSSFRRQFKKAPFVTWLLTQMKTKDDLDKFIKTYSEGKLDSFYLGFINDIIDCPYTEDSTKLFLSLYVDANKPSSIDDSD